MSDGDHDIVVPVDPPVFTEAAETQNDVFVIHFHNTAHSGVPDAFGAFVLPSPGRQIHIGHSVLGGNGILRYAALRVAADVNNVRTAGLKRVFEPVVVRKQTGSSAANSPLGS